MFQTLSPGRMMYRLVHHTFKISKQGETAVIEQVALSESTKEGPDALRIICRR